MFHCWIPCHVHQRTCFVFKRQCVCHVHGVSVALSITYDVICLFVFLLCQDKLEGIASHSTLRGKRLAFCFVGGSDQLDTRAYAKIAICIICDFIYLHLQEHVMDLFNLVSSSQVVFDVVSSCWLP